jgi:hypothetical protein
LCVLGGVALYRTNTQSVPGTAQSIRGGMPAAGTPVSAESNGGSNAIDIGALLLALHRC